MEQISQPSEKEVRQDRPRQAETRVRGEHRNGRRGPAAARNRDAGKTEKAAHRSSITTSARGRNAEPPKAAIKTARLPQDFALLTPRQKKAALARQRRKNWRRQVQDRVNKNEIVLPQHCDIVIFDLEGAGYLEEDITEIAAIKVSRTGELLATYQQLIRPITKLNKRVVAMTGITEEMLEDKPCLPEVLDDFFAFVGDNIVLGHDIGYNDIMSLNMACRRFHRTPLFLPRFLDTERIAKRLLPTETGGKFGLDALMKYYSLHTDIEHRALDDCYSTLALYRCLLKEHETRNTTPQK